MSEKAAKMCGGKKRHNSQRRADESARHTQRTTGVAMKAYECDFCHGFHVGSAERHAPEHHMKPRRDRFVSSSIPDLEYVANRHRKSSIRCTEALAATPVSAPPPAAAAPQAIPAPACPLPVLPLESPLLLQIEFEDLTDRVFGNLTVIGWGGKGRWVCRCNCGRFDYRRTATLRRLRTQNDLPPRCNECSRRGFENSLPEYALQKERI
jgi:hypothetical protein